MFLSTTKSLGQDEQASSLILVGQPLDSDTRHLFLPDQIGKDDDKNSKEKRTDLDIKTQERAGEDDKEEFGDIEVEIDFDEEQADD